MAKKKGKIILQQKEVHEPVEHYLESHVRFSLRDCTVGSSYCITGIDKNDLKRLYKTFGKIENYTWKQFRELPREKALTLETKNSETYQFLQSKFPQFKTFGHFRVDGTDSGKFRVFAGKDGTLLCILLFDSAGDVHHK